MQHMAQGQGDHTAYGVFNFDPAVTLCMHDAGQIHMLSWMFLLVTNLIILTVKESDLCTWIAFFFPVPTKQRGLDGEIRANVALRIHQLIALGLLFSWSPVWKPSDSKDVTLCWRYCYSHQPEPNPVLDWLGVGSLGLGAWLWSQKLVVRLEIGRVSNLILWLVYNMCTLFYSNFPNYYI
jgi:hypothetical protein